MATARDIVAEAMKLPDEERAEVALELLDTLEPPDPLGHLDDDAWVAEIERRAARAIRGDGQGSTWEEVRARIERQGRGGLVSGKRKCRSRHLLVSSKPCIADR
jgi:putative addiction module component (TIGR02574 family)